VTFWERVDKREVEIKRRWRRNRTDDMAQLVATGPLTVLFVVTFIFTIIGG
jgi:hypothetical protein